MRPYIYAPLLLLVSLVLNGACKDNKKATTKKLAQTTTPVSDGGTPNANPPNRGGTTPPDTATDVVDARAMDAAAAIWKSSVMKLTWKICRVQASGTSVLTTYLFKEDNQYIRTSKSFSNASCADSIVSPAGRSEAGTWTLEGPGSAVDSFNVKGTFLGSSDFYQLIQLKNQKLYFCDYDSMEHASTKEKRCTAADMTEPHSSGTPEIVTAKP